MAKRDSNKVRDEEREIETEAAYAGKGAIAGEEEGGGGIDYTMPATEKDDSVSMCQRAADEAKSDNAGDEEDRSSGTESEEEWD